MRNACSVFLGKTAENRQPVGPRCVDDIKMDLK